MTHKIEFVWQNGTLYIRKDDNYIFSYGEYIQWIREESERKIMMYKQRGL